MSRRNKDRRDETMSRPVVLMSCSTIILIKVAKIPPIFRGFQPFQIHTVKKLCPAGIVILLKRSAVHVVNETNQNDLHRPRDNNANGCTHEISGKNSSLMDLKNLAGISQENLNKLRSILGIGKSRSSQTVTESVELSQEGHDWESDSSVLVDRDRASNNSKSLNKGHSHNARQGSRLDDIEKRLYDDDDDTSSEDDDNWPRPLLKASEKGDPISKSLAKLINDSCTQQCEVKQTIEKKFPRTVSSCRPLESMMRFGVI
ncbi:hypothetical protein DPMN_162443 [Dreissena polymorpha]|uniref:Uncharacterized protein n=1 Tax=Dreissena polymorpha TaxID=45954 RepID=A0A9D4IUC1_DREPO|nr:hypothetical protein DPMN_162443 [Dreissena polymorpha]